MNHGEGTWEGQEMREALSNLNYCETRNTIKRNLTVTPGSEMIHTLYDEYVQMHFSTNLSKASEECGFEPFR